MAYEFKMRHRVQFAETDLAGIVHFSNYFRYMENTEHAFFRSLGVSIHGEQTSDGTPIGFPRVHAACDYRRPLRFEQEFEVHLLVREKRSKALIYDFIFRDLNDPTAVLARGTFTAVCIALDAETGTMKAISIPDAIARRIDAAPAEALATNGIGKETN